MQIGFDNDKYIELQTARIRERIAEFATFANYMRSHWRSVRWEAVWP